MFCRTFGYYQREYSTAYGGITHPARWGNAPFILVRPMLDGRYTKRMIVGGVRMLNAIERNAAQKAGYSSIYFIGHEGDTAEDPIKVGYTHNLIRRMGQFRGSSWKPVKLHEVLYVRGPCCFVAMRRFDTMLAHGLDDETTARAHDELQDFNAETAHIVDVEAAIHRKLKELGLHHSREWFVGGVERLVSVSRQVIAEAFEVPCYGHNSMRRLAATWVKEAGLA